MDSDSLGTTLAGPTPPVLRLVLIVGRHLTWDGVRAAIAAEPMTRLVREIEDATRAPQIVAGLEPDGILIGADIEGLDVVPLIQQLMAVSPASKLLVFGQEPDHDLEMALTHIGISGYFVWKDVSRGLLHEVLHGVFVSGLHIGSQATIDQLVAESAAGRETVSCSERELAVLHHLARGMTAREIAKRMDFDERTIRRIIAKLKITFNAPTLSTLLARAIAAGIDIDLDPPDNE